MPGGQFATVRRMPSLKDLRFISHHSDLGCCLTMMIYISKYIDSTYESFS